MINILTDNETLFNDTILNTSTTELQLTIDVKASR